MLVKDFGSVNRELQVTDLIAQNESIFGIVIFFNGMVSGGYNKI